MLWPPPSGTAEPLHQRGDGARVSGADDRVEIADVDSQLERVRRDDGEESPARRRRSMSRRSLGQIAAAVAP